MSAKGRAAWVAERPVLALNGPWGLPYAVVGVEESGVTVERGWWNIPAGDVAGRSV